MSTNFNMCVNILTTMTKNKIPHSRQHVVGVLSILTWRHDKNLMHEKMVDSQSTNVACRMDFVVKEVRLMLVANVMERPCEDLHDHMHLPI